MADTVADGRIKNQFNEQPYSERSSFCVAVMRKEYDHV